MGKHAGDEKQETVQDLPRQSTGTHRKGDKKEGPPATGKRGKRPPPCDF
jgi:hypothetical protein